MLSAYEFLISHILVVVLGILGLFGVNRSLDRAAGAPARSAEAALAPELAGLGNLSMPVSTNVPMAQRFFDQGLRLLYAFNHQEARRAFREAARLDPSLAMAHWGQAMALSPNLNAPLTPENARLASEAIARARRASSRGDERERALIDALAKRFSSNANVERAALDRAYADAMRAVAVRYPQDPNIQTIAADAVMNAMPWNYWDKDGSPKAETAAVISMLESVIAAHPDHAGAHHYTSTCSKRPTRPDAPNGARIVLDH